VTHTKFGGDLLGGSIVIEGQRSVGRYISLNSLLHVDTKILTYTLMHATYLQQLLTNASTPGVLLFIFLSFKVCLAKLSRRVFFAQEKIPNRQLAKI